MQNFNKDDVGAKLYINFGEDISTATSYGMTIEPERGPKQEVTPTLGTSDVTVGNQDFLANQYVYYALTSEQFENDVGRARAKAKASFSSTDIRSTDYVMFRVMA